MNNKTCVGAGLVALDIILNGSKEKQPIISTGGTCGNVLSILAFLGWKTIPIARLGLNDASNKILEDLKKNGVDTTLVEASESGNTPIIIHRIIKKDNKITHRFEFKDPDNGNWLPRYKPVLSKDVERIVNKNNEKSPRVFFFDKISRSTINFAKHYKKQGSVIYFEPSSYGRNLKMFNECLDVADILKFSEDRIDDHLEKKQKVPIEIITRGSQGIIYRYKRGTKSSGWITQKAMKVLDFKDSAGSGDWCSAGIISLLFAEDKFNIKKLNGNSIDRAIRFGQVLGALNCMFDGARGLMYSLNSNQLDETLLKEEQFSLNDLNLYEKERLIKLDKKTSIKSLYY
ncbi:PfkB family carbohydrate kinase [Gracilimonas tropica]|uniref:PfkB family carbohydrate kinase n=1 Tax=Gracilimonas tropica TaxID=454600 RepID=UPI00036D6B77|nr:PfkB family carbohydrate kinase [Gracilimonas tropica]